MSDAGPDSSGSSSDAYQNFGDIFSEVLENVDHDPILHLVVLTYEFDEQQMLNLIGGKSLDEDTGFRPSRLKLLADIRPVVIFDARKTKPYMNLPQFLELHPYKTPGFACHHSKAYLIVTAKVVRLVIGSFNLTETGLFRNREVFESWIWSESNLVDLNVLAEFIDLLATQYVPQTVESAASALQEVLATLGKRVAGWQPDSESTCRLVASGYGDTPGLDQIVGIWNAWFPGTSPDSLFAVSPFFDEVPQNGCIADHWIERFPSIASIQLVTDEVTFPNLSQRHFGVFDGEKSLLLIPTSISDAERDRIVAKAKGGSKDIAITRALHAKILLLESADGDALVYVGSANFSQKAWRGANRELGVATRVADPQRLKRQILKHLYTSFGQDRFPELPRQPPVTPPQSDDEGYREDGYFPEFLNYLVLYPVDGGEQLEFQAIGTELDRLSLYRINWAGHRLNFNAGRSQPIPRGSFENALLAGRTVEFRSEQAPEQAYWFPFQYAGQLLADREILLHRTTWDWFSFYLNPTRSDDDGPVFLPGTGHTDSTTPVRPAFDVDRDANCVIAMQRYLNLFSQIERSFSERMKLILDQALGNEMEKVIENQVTVPLGGLLALLIRETADNQTDSLFKIGELKLLVVHLRSIVDSPEKQPFDSLLKWIDETIAAVSCQDSLAPDYSRFLEMETALHK